jgi:hypothetical protein
MLDARFIHIDPGRIRPFRTITNAGYFRSKPTKPLKFINYGWRANNSMNYRIITALLLRRGLKKLI